MQRCNPSSLVPSGEGQFDPVWLAGTGWQAEGIWLPVKFFAACQSLKHLHSGRCDKPVFVREKGI